MATAFDAANVMIINFLFVCSIADTVFVLIAHEFLFTHLRIVSYETHIDILCAFNTCAYSRLLNYPHDPYQHSFSVITNSNSGVKHWRFGHG